MLSLLATRDEDDGVLVQKEAEAEAAAIAKAVQEFRVGREVGAQERDSWCHMSVERERALTGC